MNYIVQAFVFLLLLLSAPVVWAEDEHPGYLSDVNEEKHLKVVEFVLPPKAKENNIDLKKLIFTDEFSKDMLSRYHRQFGYTETQINITAPNRFEEFTSFDGTRVTVEEDVRRKRRFAGFMLRKLAEYHVDDYLKSNNKTKKIYQIKKQISNTQIGLKGGFKLRARYSFSGNTIKLRLKNPHHLSNQLIIDLDPEVSASSNKNYNIIAHIGFPIFWNLQFNNYYDFGKRDLTTLFIKPLPSGINLSLTNIFSLDTVNSENRIILGLNWRY